MKFNIRGKKVEVTTSIKNYIEDKIGKLDKYFENPNELTATILIKVKTHDQIVEVTIPTKELTLRGEESNKDLYAAVDLVLEKIERQIRKNKSRIKKRNKSINIGFNTDFDSLDEDETTKVVRRKIIDTKPMSEEEAILQMNLLGHEFFMFRDIKSEQMCILYKRKDGNYGIIETN